MRVLSHPMSLLCAAAVASSNVLAQAEPSAPAGPAAQIDTTPSRLIPARASTYDGKLTVPEGFKVTKYASVANARAMIVAPDGSVYVSTPGRNAIVRLLDLNTDGVADTAVVVLTGLDRPHGMAFHNGRFFVANTGGVVRFALDAQGIPTGAPEQLNRYDPGKNHWTRSIVFGADNKMYVSIGSTCNLCVETAPERAAVMQYDENGQNGRVFSRGLRNAVGMAVNPVTKQIWVTQHERDNLAPDHQNLPTEELNLLSAGKDYGWPYCHGPRIPNPEYHDAARCAATESPALRMQAHSAPLGMTFLDKATAFPADWRGDALVAFHGSWNRDTPTGAKVVRVRVRNGKPVSYEDFITGWQGETGARWGRPVDFAVLRDGSVLVSDDAGGTIFRVTATR
ncbi:MAG: sorbosone dehydrogenase family protein [Gemmatimonadaceae bacterium]|nr:sorbosone dehydrogenase family protein [Gemmatimonadaceae bacterium]